MKRRILTIALALIIGATTFITSDSVAHAQGQMRTVADSGAITLGPNQVLRVTVAAGDVNADDNVRVRFRQIGYEPCQPSPKLCVASQTTSNPITLAPNEAAVDVVDYISSSLRTVVLSNRPDAKIVFIVFDTSTQRVVSIISDKATPKLIE